MSYFVLRRVFYKFLLSKPYMGLEKNQLYYPKFDQNSV